MSGNDASSLIARELLLEVFAQARAAYPAECCGWLSGPRSKPVTQLRPCANAQADGGTGAVADRSEEAAYVIAGDDLIALSKSIDSESPAQVIYHSHPNGRAYFSDTDRAVATSPWGDGPSYPVTQLVVGLDQDRVVEAALFGWSDDVGGFVELARFSGASM